MQDSAEVSFSLEKNLMQDLEIHTTEKHYKCEHCNEAFTQDCSLRQHIAEMHRSSHDDEDADARY